MDGRLARRSESTTVFAFRNLTIGCSRITMGSADRSAWIQEMILKFTRNRYQEGSLRKVRRKSGAEMWEYRYRNHAEPGSPMRQITLSVLEYPTERKERIGLQEEVMRINGPRPVRARI